MPEPTYTVKGYLPYGLEYEEALEMTYENVIEEARSALAGYRRKKPKPPSPPADLPRTSLAEPPA